MGQKKLDLEAAEAEWVDIGTLTPWDKNPRKNDGAVKSVAESIKRFGWASPILVREQDNVIIAGHTRYKAAKMLGLDKVLIRRLPLDPAQAKALALADNKLNELAEWDNSTLDEILNELLSEGEDVYLLGWSPEEIEKIISSGCGDDVIREMIDPPEVPYNSNGNRVNDEKLSDGLSPVDAKDVQMVQIFFSGHQHAQFLEWCRTARRDGGMATVSDIVYLAMERSFGGEK